jgi:exodeoxyribonuclease-3
VKLASWNVNGIRACGRAGLLEWLAREQPDVVCLQEVKVQPAQLPPELSALPGYELHWHCAEKAGYSGVAVFTRPKPRAVRAGLGVPEFDREGRVLLLEYDAFVLVNAYFPNSQRDHARLPYKLRFCRRLQRLLRSLRESGRAVAICGDYNIAHREIDLANPQQNRSNAGFLPQERAWLDRLLAGPYIDAFRHFEPGPGHYTWWSYRPTVRERNIGWRLDHWVVSRELEDSLRAASHQPEVRGSDHCPVLLELRA